jgi:hypothetical protein
MGEAMQQKVNPEADGLIITNPDHTSQEEIDAFRAYYAATKGKSLPGLEMWLELRPDVLKRYRAGVRETTSAQWRAYPLPMVLQHLHQYAIIGYDDGIAFQLNVARAAGATRGVLLDVLAVAFLHSGPRGMNYVAGSSLQALRDYEDPDPAGRWPEGWALDIEALRSGADFTSVEATPADIEAITGWYESAIGEVPPYVTFLARERPNFLKAYRNRYEHAIRDALPKQELAYLMLNYNVSRGFADGIRENYLLGRAWGIAPEMLADAITWGFYYGGVECIGAAQTALGDLLDGVR